MSSGGKKRLQKMVHVGPNMTPMVDVVMCILIFFMLGSSFIMPELFLKSSMPAIDKAGLGQKAADAKMPAVKLWIKLARKGDDPSTRDTYVSAFDWAPVKLRQPKDPAPTDSDQTRHAIADENTKVVNEHDSLAAMFVQKNQNLSPDVQIIIQPNADVPYQDVITIYDFCVKAKFKQVAFAPAG